MVLYWECVFAGALLTETWKTEREYEEKTVGEWAKIETGDLLLEASVPKQTDNVIWYNYVTSDSFEKDRHVNDQ